MKSQIRIIAVILVIALTAAISAFADYTETFIFDANRTGGAPPLPGGQAMFTGSFSWDPTGGNLNIDAFSTNYPGWVDATTNYAATVNDFVYAYYDGGNGNPNGIGEGYGLVLMYLPFASPSSLYPGVPIGNPADAMYFESGKFLAGTTDEINFGFTIQYYGHVNYGPILGSNPDAPAVPEPGTFLLLASGLSGMLGAIRRKIKA